MENGEYYNQFRIKGNGTCGAVKFTDGMNVEVTNISERRKGANPFNTTVEKLFVQEFANKYHIEPKNISAIRMLFNRQRCDVTEL